jgi:hypothetical protein
METVEKFDKKIVRDIMNSNILKLKNDIVEKTKEISGEVLEIDKNDFDFLKNVCENLDVSGEKKCENIVNKNIRELIKDAKDSVKKIREQVKEIRELVKERNAMKRNTINSISENMLNNKEQYEAYMKTPMYMFKNKCGKKITSTSKIEEFSKDFPEILSYDEQMGELNGKIKELNDSLKENLIRHKLRMEHLKKILKKNLSELESSVINMTIKEERMSHKMTMKQKTKDVNSMKKPLNDSLKVLERNKKKAYKDIRKTLKKQIRIEDKNEKLVLLEENKLRKTAKKHGELRTELKDKLILDLVDKYKEKIQNELINEKKKELGKIAAKELAIKQKQEEQIRKKEEIKKKKETARQTKKRENELKKAERKTKKTEK